MPKGSKCLITKKLNKADPGGIEPPKLGSANAEASETQRRIQWATDPAADSAELCPLFTRLWRRNLFLGVCMTYHFWSMSA
jgi:hypothetical protein